MAKLLSLEFVLYLLLAENLFLFNGVVEHMFYSNKVVRRSYYSFWKAVSVGFFLFVLIRKFSW